MSIIFIKDILGVFAVALGLFAYVFYVRGIMQGKVKPHAFTWFVWGLLTTIAFVAQITKGGGVGSWVTGFTALCSFGFTIIGLRASSRELISQSDWIFFLGALVTIPIWYLTGNPLWSVIIITIVDFVAFIPTIRKAFAHPDSENGWTYTLSSLKFVFSLFALGNFDWITALYPASLVVGNFAFVFMLILRKELKK